MCRGGQDGRVKRCPSHSDPQKIAQRNQRRRELRATVAQRTELAASLKNDSIKFERGETFAAEYYIGKEAFDRTKLGAVEDEIPSQIDGEYIRGRLKPTGSSGIWTSAGTQKEDGSIATQWSESSAASQMVEDGDQAHAVKPMKDAVIVRIDDAEDLQRLYEKFPSVDGRMSFEKMAEAGIDGVHVSQEAVNESNRHFGSKENVMSDLYGWDMPSTIWMNGSLLQAGAVKSIHKVEVDHSDGYGFDGDDDYDFENSAFGPKYTSALDHYRGLKADSDAQGVSPEIDLKEEHMTALLNSSFTYKHRETGEVVKVFQDPAFNGATFKNTDGTTSTAAPADFAVGVTDNEGNLTENRRLMNGGLFTRDYKMYFGV